MNKIKEVMEEYQRDGLFSEEGLDSLIQLAEDVIALDGMVEKKGLFGDTPQSELIKRCGFNEGREQTIKAVAGRMHSMDDKIEKLLWEMPELQVVDRSLLAGGVGQAIRNHLLKEDV